MLSKRLFFLILFLLLNISLISSEQFFVNQFNSPDCASLKEEVSCVETDGVPGDVGYGNSYKRDFMAISFDCGDPKIFQDICGCVNTKFLERVPKKFRDKYLLAGFTDNPTECKEGFDYVLDSNCGTDGTFFFNTTLSKCEFGCERGACISKEKVKIIKKFSELIGKRCSSFGEENGDLLIEDEGSSFLFIKLKEQKFFDCSSVGLHCVDNGEFAKCMDTGRSISEVNSYFLEDQKKSNLKLGDFILKDFGDENIFDVRLSSVVYNQAKRGDLDTKSILFYLDYLVKAKDYSGVDLILDSIENNNSKEKLRILEFVFNSSYAEKRDFLKYYATFDWNKKNLAMLIKYLDISFEIEKDKNKLFNFLMEKLDKEDFFLGKDFILKFLISYFSNNPLFIQNEEKLKKIVEEERIAELENLDPDYTVSEVYALYKDLPLFKKIINSPYLKDKSFGERNSIALVTFRLLKKYPKLNFEEGLKYILFERKKFSEQVLIDENTTMVIFRDPSFIFDSDVRKILEVVNQVGVKSWNIFVAPLNKKNYQYYFNLSREKKIFMIFVAHGSPEAIVPKGHYSSEDLTPKLMAKFLKNPKSSNPKNLVIFNSGCRAYNFFQNVFSYLPQPEFKNYPIFIANSNKDVYDYFEVGIWNHLSKLNQSSRKAFFGRDFLKADAKSYLKNFVDPAIFYPVCETCAPLEITSNSFLSEKCLECEGNSCPILYS